MLKFNLFYLWNTVSINLLLLFFLFSKFANSALPPSQKNQRPSLKSNLIAEHSRRTHQDFREKLNSQEANNLQDILKSVEEIHGVPESGSAFRGIFKDSSSLSFQQTKKLFEQIEEDGILTSEENPKNPFRVPSFDDNYKTHSICEEWNSGRQGNMLNLEYTESADRLLKIIGNGVVKNGYNMFMAPGQSQRPPVTTNVSVAVYIESMSSFRAQTMDYEVDMYLAMVSKNLTRV